MGFEKIEPEYWKHENPDDEIIGTLIKIETEKGTYKSTIYHLDVDKKGMIVVFGSTVLDDRMRFVNLNDKIKIIYKGTVQGESSSHKPYKDYEVYVDKEEIK